MINCEDCRNFDGWDEMCRNGECFPVKKLKKCVSYRNRKEPIMEDESRPAAIWTTTETRKELQQIKLDENLPSLDSVVKLTIKSYKNGKKKRA